MSHDDKNRLSRYLEGELSPAEKGEVEEHLNACSDCRADLATLRELVRSLRSLREDRWVGDLWPAIEERLARPRGWEFWRLVPRPLEVAAVLVVLLWVGIWMRDLPDRFDSGAFGPDTYPAPAPPQETLEEWFRSLPSIEFDPGNGELSRETERLLATIGDRVQRARSPYSLRIERYRPSQESEETSRSLARRMISILEGAGIPRDHILWVEKEPPEGESRLEDLQEGEIRLILQPTDR